MVINKDHKLILMVELDDVIALTSKKLFFKLLKNKKIIEYLKDTGKFIELEDAYLRTKKSFIEFYNIEDKYIQALVEAEYNLDDLFYVDVEYSYALYSITKIKHMFDTIHILSSTPNKDFYYNKTKNKMLEDLKNYFGVNCNIQNIEGESKIKHIIEKEIEFNVCFEHDTNELYDIATIHMPFTHSVECYIPIYSYNITYTKEQLKMFIAKEFKLIGFVNNFEENVEV